MRFTSLVAGLLALVEAINGFQIYDLKPMEALPAVPEGWVQVGTPLDGSKRLHFRIAVSQVRKILLFTTPRSIESILNTPKPGMKME